MAGGSPAVSAAGCANMTILKNTSIVVRVEEALADLLVVSYRPQECDVLYQGVLLHSNKTNLPYGVYSLHPAFTQQVKVDPTEDKLHSVSQRFSYQEPQYAKPSPPAASLAKRKNRQKMTVRLRPRKVLCSKCQGICNENSESIDTGRKRKLAPPAMSQYDEEKTIMMGNSLIPKLSRLQPSEITSALSGGAKQAASKPAANVQSSKSDIESRVTNELTFVDVTSDMKSPNSETDEPNTNFAGMFASAKTLKICFGEGEGTVVKLPANVGDFNDDSGVACDVAKTNVDIKAAKRALKKAKKQAKKNVAPKQLPITSPIVSPRHMGALSPRNNVPSNTPPSITDAIHKRRHKVKHKKKRRIERERDENTTKSEAPSDGDECSNQKLSISFKRLNRNLYTHRVSESGSEAGEEGVPEFPANSTCDSSSTGVGSSMNSGDVVWGKLTGFPWWPGKILSVSSGYAHVSWYASTTCSYIHSNNLSPFLDDYKARFNKKKRGAYKEAVRLATVDAHLKEHADPLSGESPTVLPAMSPRPIDAFS